MLVHLTELPGPGEGLDDYVSMTDVALRRTLEAQRGLYMAESTNVIARALAAGHRPRSFLMAPRWLETMAPHIAAAPGTGGDPHGGEVPVFVADEPLLKQLTGFHLHRGALAAMHRPELPDVAELLGAARRGPDGRAGPARRVAVLEDVVDHTNVGAMFRSAAGLGVDAVLVTPSCADPLYRRSVRVSMGTVFQVPWTRIPSWPGGAYRLKELGYTVAALALSEDAVALDEFAASPAVAGADSTIALLLGTEGHGLTDAAVRAADVVVRIPMAGGVDSLNVAAASAVAFWATRVAG